MSANWFSGMNVGALRFYLRYLCHQHMLQQVRGIANTNFMSVNCFSGMNAGALRFYLRYLCHQHMLQQVSGLDWLLW